MRVIAGKARSLALKTIEGNGTRPTTDRIKETLFNMLSPRIPGCRFLDLFSGSGGIAIEALSRGAQSAVLVENNRQAADCIRHNLAFTHLAYGARLMQTDVFAALRMLEGKETFDLVFMDPPYDHEFEKRVLEYLSASGLITADSPIVIEASKHTDFSYLESLGFETVKRKEYKTNMHMFVQRLQQ